MIVIRKFLAIDAGHRLLGHEGKCRHVHGHRYSFVIEATAPELDTVGRVVDFGVIKQVVGGWLDQHLDHGFIAERGDPIIPFLTDHGNKVFILDVPPTAENLARLVFQQCQSFDLKGARVLSVQCLETPTSAAIYQHDDL